MQTAGEAVPIAENNRAEGADFKLMEEDLQLACATHRILFITGLGKAA